MAHWTLHLEGDGPPETAKAAISAFRSAVAKVRAAQPLDAQLAGGVSGADQTESFSVTVGEIPDPRTKKKGKTG